MSSLYWCNLPACISTNLQDEEHLCSTGSQQTSHPVTRCCGSSQPHEVHSHPINDRHRAHLVQELKRAKLPANKNQALLVHWNPL